MRRKGSSTLTTSAGARGGGRAAALRRWLFLLPLLLVVAPAAPAAAQQPAAETAATPQPPAVSPADTHSATPAASPAGVGGADGAADERYRIGPGDVIEVRIFNRPQLSRDAVRVDARGLIRMPLIEGEIQAACRTEGELSRVIATSYLKYQRNPQVDVFVKDYQSQPVAIIGAVGKPGQFQLQRRVRLLELLSLAGGPSERAGRSLHLVRSAPAMLCDAPGAAAFAGEPAAEGLISLRLSDTLQGKEGANPYLLPGDVINIVEAEQAFVVGNVLKPAAVELREPVTVSQAIAMAGGTLPNSRKDKVRIIRQPQGGAAKTELFVNLSSIDKRKAEDITLEPGDIVEVQTVTGVQSIVRGVLSTLVPTLTQYPTRVIMR